MHTMSTKRRFRLSSQGSNSGLGSTQVFNLRMTIVHYGYRRQTAEQGDHQEGGRTSQTKAKERGAQGAREEGREKRSRESKYRSASFRTTTHLISPRRGHDHQTGHGKDPQARGTPAQVPVARQCSKEGLSASSRRATPS